MCACWLGNDIRHSTDLQKISKLILVIGTYKEALALIHSVVIVEAACGGHLVRSLEVLLEAKLAFFILLS